MEKTIFLSYFLNKDTPLYGGTKGVKIKKGNSIENGDSSNTKKIKFNNHSGTHIDFPNHFFIDGKTSDFYLADFWVFKFPFLVTIDVKENEIIDFEESTIKNIPKETDFLIIKTGFCKYRYDEKYWKYNPGLSPELGKKLRNNLPNIKVIGVDLISISSYQNRQLGRESHKVFLNKNKPILLIEDMKLCQLYKTPKSISCLPILIEGIDGAPITITATV